VIIIKYPTINKIHQLHHYKDIEIISIMDWKITK